MKQITKVLVACIIFAVPFASVSAGDALDRINKEGVIKVSSDPNWPPQSFLNDSNEMDGFDVDVAKEIAKRMGVKVEFVTPSWDIITAGNWHGRWDMSVGSMTPTKERATVLAFPAIYYYTPASFAVHADSTAKSLGDLDGKVIGASTSSTFSLYLQKDLTIDAEGAPAFEYQVTPSKIKHYESSTVAFDDLRLGDGTRLSGMVTSLPSILEAIKNNYPLKVLGSPAFYEPLSVAIDLGDEELGAAIKGAVTAMRADGTLKALSVKWYEVDYSSVQ